MFDRSDDDFVPFSSLQEEGGTSELITKDQGKSSMSKSMVMDPKDFIDEKIAFDEI